MLNILVVPYNHNYNGEKYTKRIVKYLKSEKIEFSVYFSTSFDEFKTNTHNLVQSGETEFVIVGDDIALSEFINSIKDLSKIRLGIVPTSKNDDFASYIGLETNPISAIKEILKKKIEAVDVLIMNDIKVIGNILIGASTFIQEIFNQYKIKNAISKKYAFERYANKFDGIELKIETKNQKIANANIFELSIANGGKSKGKTISPLANVNDGLFNLNFVTTPPRDNRKKYLKLFKKGEQIYNEQTKQSWQTNINITNPDNKIKVMADGKIMTVDELNVSIIENGLKLYR